MPPLLPSLTNYGDVTNINPQEVTGILLVLYPILTMEDQSFWLPMRA